MILHLNRKLVMAFIGVLTLSCAYANNAGLDAFVAGDFQEALAQWKSISETDPAEAENWFYLGLMHEKGLGVEKNQTEAKKYYTISSQLGSSSSLFKLGALAEIDKDYLTAIKFWELAAEQELPEAAYNLGNLYNLGLGVEVDIDKAMYWYKSSAKFALDKAADFASKQQEKPTPDQVLNSKAAGDEN